MSDKKWRAAAGIGGVLWMALNGVPVLGEAFGVKAARADDASQALSTNTPVFKVTRGGRSALPMKNVVRVVPDDEDVARGFYTPGRVVLEGVTVGETGVDVITRDNRHQRLIVQVVSPGVDTGTPAIVPSSPAETPLTVPAAVPPMGLGGADVTARQLGVSLRMETPRDNRAQSLATISYVNKGTNEARDVVVRFIFDEPVAYVTNSATNGGKYDSSTRELSWQVGTLAAGATGQVKFRIAPVDPSTTSIQAAASIEDTSHNAEVSNVATYYFSPAPLVAIFALPDRFLAGRNMAAPTDVANGDVKNAVMRLQRNDVVRGTGGGRFSPNVATQRAAFVVMTLNGLNVRDVRDVSAIKFVLGRRSTVDLVIRDSKNRIVKTLAKNVTLDANEHTKIWDGMGDDGRYVAPGTYYYECSARDVARSETTRLRGTLTVVPQTPLQAGGQPTFTDVKPSDWYAGYLAIAEKQNLVKGYLDNSFKPEKSISRVEATVIIVRALGMEDLAKQYQDQDLAFFDYRDIPKYANGHVNVAVTMAKTQGGGLILGYPGNKYLPLKALRRDEAALVIQRIIDKEGPRKMHISGVLSPGGSINIDGKNVNPNDQGQFEFVLDQSNTQPSTVFVQAAGG